MKDFYGKEINVGDTVLVSCTSNSIYTAVGTVVRKGLWYNKLAVKFPRFNPDKNLWEYKTIVCPEPKVIFKVNYKPEPIERFNAFFKECIE